MLGFVIFISKRRFVSLQNQFSWKLYSSILFCNCQKCHLPFDPFFNFHVSKNHHIKVKIFARCCKMCVVDKIPILFLVCLDTADQSFRVLEQFTNSSSLFCCWTLLFHFTCVYVKIWRKKAALPYRPALKNSILRNATQLFVDAMASKPSKHHRLNQQTDRRLEEVLLDTRISPSKHSPQHTIHFEMQCWGLKELKYFWLTKKTLIKDFEDLSYVYFFVVFFVIMYILTKARKLSMIVKMYELQNMCFSFSWQ